MRTQTALALFCNIVDFGMFSTQFPRFAPHSLALLLILVSTSAISLHESNSQFASATPTTESASQNSTRSRWTRAMRVDSNSLQTVSLLLSIREKLYEIGDKQKHEITPSRISNDLDVISHRLQNVEEQISRAESYNKMRLEQLMESAMKNEFLIDQLARRVEKNHQNINNRLSDMDSSLEKASKTRQENTEKIISKIETTNASPSTNIDLRIHSSTPLPLQENIQTQHILDSENNADELENVDEDDEGDGYISNDDNDGTGALSNGTSLLKIVHTAKRLVLADVQKFVKTQSDRIVSVMDEKHTQLLRQVAFLNNSLDECVSLANKIYAKSGDQRLDSTNYVDNFIESLIVQINSQNVRNIDQLKTIMKNSTDAVLHQQRIFGNNCRRLQSNEEQMEDKVVAILQNLYNHVDEQNERSQRYIEIIAESQQCDLIREVIGQNSNQMLTTTEPDQVADQLQQDAISSSTEQSPPTSVTDISSTSESTSSSNLTTSSPSHIEESTPKMVSLQNSTSIETDTVYKKLTANAVAENSQHLTAGDGNGDAGDRAKSQPVAPRNQPRPPPAAVEQRVRKTSDLDWIQVEDSSSSSLNDRDQQHQFASPHKSRDFA